MNSAPQPMASWRAGVARLDITPTEPIWIAGYAHRRTPSQGVEHALYARALAIEDCDGTLSVLLCADLLGLRAAAIEYVADALFTRFGLARENLVINFSHSHSAPVTDDLIFDCYPLTDADLAAISRYTAWLLRRLVATAVAAIEDLQPAQIAFGQGFAGFGVNRRRARGDSRHLPGTVDHDVPVLSVRDLDGELRGVVYGYACHATTSGGSMIHGDFPGFASAALESSYPHAVALFAAGCGADINPLPRFREGLAETYGHLLATAVRDVLEGPSGPYNTGPSMQALSGPLNTELARVDLTLQPSPGRNASPSCPYTIQTWRFGNDLKCIWLSGEPVVDYALSFKAQFGWENTWVSGYCNELVGYIPSKRVLIEGGYEGGLGNADYGLRSPFTPDVESRIAQTVHALLARAPREAAVLA